MKELRISEMGSMFGYLHSSFRNLTTQTDSYELGPNLAAYNNTYQALHINDNSDALKGTLEIPIGFLRIGDKVDVKMETLNVSGTKVKVALDFSDSSFATNSNQATYQAVGGNQFVSFGTTFIATRNDYAKIVIGTFTTDIGNNYIRDIRISIDSAGETQRLQEKPRFYAISGTANGLINRSEFTNDSCVITTNSTSIVVRHAKPFVSYTPRGQAMAQISGNASFGKYIAKTRNEQLTDVTVEIYDTTTGTIVNPSQFINDTNFFLKLSHWGYEYIK